MAEVQTPIFNDRKYKTKGMKSRKYLKKRSKICLPDVKDKTILEIGSNSGYDTFLMLKKGAKEIIAIDWEKKFIDISKNVQKKENIKNVKFINNSWQDYFQETNDYYDIIVAFCSIAFSELEKSLPILLERCDRFVWTRDNSEEEGDKQIKSWDDSEMKELLLKFPNHNIIKKYTSLNTSRILKFKYVDYWIEFF